MLQTRVALPVQGNRVKWSAWFRFATLCRLSAMPGSAQDSVNSAWHWDVHSRCRGCPVRGVIASHKLESPAIRRCRPPVLGAGFCSATGHEVVIRHVASKPLPAKPCNGPEIQFGESLIFRIILCFRDATASYRASWY